MKILIANWVYNWGSTGYIVRDMKSVLEGNGYDVDVAAGFDRGTPKSGVFTFCTRVETSIYYRLNRWLGFPQFGGSPIATYKIIDFIKKEKPDLVHIHILNIMCCNMYKVLEFLGKNNYKTVITHHAEFYYTGSCSHAYDCNRWIKQECTGCEQVFSATGSRYFGNPHKMWKRMQKAFSFFKTENLVMTAVSPWVRSRSLESPYLKCFRCETVMNGVETSLFYHRDMSNIISNRISNGNNRYLLSVYAYFNPANKSDVKGGAYLVELARLMPDQLFVVVCTTHANCEDLPNNIILWGKAKNQDELAVLYSNASLLILTSRRETFSMVTAESLCCGTPVVGFEAGGPESIAIKEYSCFVEPTNITALQDAIVKMLSIHFDQKQISYEARNRYSKKAMVDGYLTVYKSLFQKH